MIIATLLAVLTVVAWGCFGVWLVCRMVENVRYPGAIFIAWIIVTLIIQRIVSHV